MKKVDIIIIGAGPVGLFTVFEAGLLGLNCLLIDNLEKPHAFMFFYQSKERLSYKEIEEKTIQLFQKFNQTQK